MVRGHMLASGLKGMLVALPAILESRIGHVVCEPCRVQCAGIQVLERAVLLCAKAVSDIKGDAAHDDVKFVVEKVGELSDKDYNDFMKITGIYMELNREKAKTQKPTAKPNPFRK